MSTMTVTAKNSSRLLTRELVEPAERLDDALRIAQAIAQLMDPEWRELVDEEQREKRRIASPALTKANHSNGAPQPGRDFSPRLRRWRRNRARIPVLRENQRGADCRGNSNGLA